MSLTALFLRLRAGLLGVIRRGSLDRDMRAEMAEHLARATDRYAASGLTEAEAREAARREFGNVAVLQEEGRDARGGRWLESLVADVRFALRQIARRPLASATIVGVLALGIGVHAGLFSLFQAITVRPAPGVRADDALVRLRGKEQSLQHGPWYPRDLSYPEFADIAARRDLFATTAAWTTSLVTMDPGDGTATTSAQVHFVAGDYFTVGGVRIALGTTLPLAARADAGEGGGQSQTVAIVSDALWHDLLGGTTDVIGRIVRLNDTPVRIIGVAPAPFNGFAASGSRRTMWMPLGSRSTVIHNSRRALIDRDSALLSGAALLARGVSIERASAAVSRISDQATARMTPAEDHRIRTADVVPLRKSTELPVDPDIFVGSALFGIIALLVLIVACTNVSALVIGAGVTRAQEIAIRLSLGASRWRLVRQLVTESCVLAVAGGVAGLALYAAFTRVATQMLPGVEIRPDAGTVVFTMLLAVGTGILFGLSPALHATRAGVSEVLKSGNASGGASARTRLQSSFIVVQIAVTQPLLLGVALMLALAARQNANVVEPNVSSHVVHMEFDLQRASPDARARLRAAMTSLQALPGVQHVTSEPSGPDVDFSVASDSRGGLLRDPLASVHIEESSPGYFALLEVPIVRGRDLALADTAANDLAVVIGSEFAHELWGNADPIGRRFEQFDNGKLLERKAVIVGVYDAARPTTRGPGRRVFAIDNSGWRDFSYLARTSGPARAAIPAIREHLRALLPDLPLAGIVSLEDEINEERREITQVGVGAAVAGALVMLLASIGLYGVIGLAVAQRRREIGIRIALGAQPRAAVALLFGQGLRLAALGLLIGLPFSVAALVAIRSLGGNGDADLGSMIGMSPTLVGVLIGVAVLIVAAIATWLPARRAAGVDPLLALRVE
jgi:predicted permease